MLNRWERYSRLISMFGRVGSNFLLGREEHKNSDHSYIKAYITYCEHFSSPAVRRLGYCGLFLGLAGGRVRYQVSAHVGPRAVVDVKVAVFHLLGDIANALSESFPILEEENDIGREAQSLKRGAARWTTALGLPRSQPAALPFTNAQNVRPMTTNVRSLTSEQQGTFTMALHTRNVITPGLDRRRFEIGNSTSLSRIGVEPRVRIHRKFSVRIPITSEASELMKYSISME